MDEPNERQADERAAKQPSVLRNRNFRLYWTGETISIIGSSIGQFAFGLVAVIVLDATAGQMGLILALGKAPPIVLGLLAGDLVDRIRRRRLLMILGLCAGALVASVPVLYALDLLTVQWLYLTSVLFGILDSIFDPAWNAFMPSLVPRDRLVDANSKVMLSWASSGLIGPGIAGVLVEIISAPATMFVDAASFVVSAALLSRIRVGESVKKVDTDLRAIAARVREGLRTTFRDAMQRAVTMPRVILDFVDALSLAVYVLYVFRTVGLSPALLGVIFTCGAAGFTAASLVTSRIERRMGAGPAAFMGLVLVGASPFTMILADAANPTWLNVVYLALPGVLGGFGGMIQFVMLASIRQAITPDELMGRVFASAGVLRSVMSVLGALTGGWLGDAIGLRPTIAVAAVGYTIPIWYSLLSPLRRATTRGDSSELDGVSDGVPDPA